MMLMVVAIMLQFCCNSVAILLQLCCNYVCKKQDVQMKQVFVCVCGIVFCVTIVFLVLKCNTQKTYCVCEHMSRNDELAATLLCNTCMCLIYFQNIA